MSDESTLMYKKLFLSSFIIILTLVIFLCRKYYSEVLKKTIFTNAIVSNNGMTDITNNFVETTCLISISSGKKLNLKNDEIRIQDGDKPFYIKNGDSEGVSICFDNGTYWGNSDISYMTTVDGKLLFKKTEGIKWNIFKKENNIFFKIAGEDLFIKLKGCHPLSPQSKIFGSLVQFSEKPTVFNLTPVEDKSFNQNTFLYMWIFFIYLFLISNFYLTFRT